MEFHFLPIFAFLSLALVAIHAALTPEAYWKSVLPNTPMPKAIMDLLHPGKRKAGVGTNIDIDISNIVRYYEAASDNEDQFHDTTNVVAYFLENDMKPGMTMNLHFTKSKNAATFLPRQVVESIPFSSNKMQQILDHFSVKTYSTEADIMKQIIELCEKPGIEGEEKYCATSLESIIDFSTSKLGNYNNVQAIATMVEKETAQVEKYYSIAGAKMVGEDAVVCHKQNYEYAVFYCHKTRATKEYMVSLVGTGDGTKAKAVAICHTDTSQWDPKNLAFQWLKVKPGNTLPICHFLNEDDIVWIAN
ncbi:BURP domain-containing protein 3-like [Cornus florida]|uniref:BURP domain-containing protein 3-like n=1 Tax=Cornus florida TaxID=4283 RepID=UPI00289719A0|nr:BURP domain-containing protein 3-like [Cornus florida]